MADDKIIQTIELQGADQVERDLDRLGRAGEKAFDGLARSADKADFRKIEKDIHGVSSATETLGSQAGKATRDVDDLTGSTDRFARSLDGVRTSVESTVVSFRTLALSVAATVATLAGLGAAMFAAAKNSATLASEIGSAADKAKQSLADYQRMQFILRGLGLSSEEASEAIRELGSEAKKTKVTMGRFAQEFFNMRGTVFAPTEAGFKAMREHMVQLAQKAAQGTIPLSEIRALLEKFGDTTDPKKMVEFANALGRLVEEAKILNKVRGIGPGVFMIPGIDKAEKEMERYRKALAAFKEEATPANFVKFVDALLKIPDASRRAELATEALGETAGRKLIRALADNNSEIRRLLARYKELRLGVSDAQRAVADKFNIALAEMAAVARQGQVELGALFQEPLIPLMHRWNTLVRTGRSSLFEWAKSIRDAAIPALSDLLKMLEGAPDVQIETKWLLSLRDAFKSAGAAAKILFYEVIVPGAKAADQALQFLLDQVNKVFGTQFSIADVGILAILTALVGGFQALGLAIAALFVGEGPQIEKFKNSLKELGVDIEAIKGFFKGTVSELKIFGKDFTRIGESLKNLWGDLVKLFSGDTKNISKSNQWLADLADNLQTIAFILGLIGARRIGLLTLAHFTGVLRLLSTVALIAAGALSALVSVLRILEIVTLGLGGSFARVLIGLGALTAGFILLMVFWKEVRAAGQLLVDTLNALFGTNFTNYQLKIVAMGLAIATLVGWLLRLALGAVAGARGLTLLGAAMTLIARHPFTVALGILAAALLLLADNGKLAKDILKAIGVDAEKANKFVDDLIATLKKIGQIPQVKEAGQKIGQFLKGLSKDVDDFIRTWATKGFGEAIKQDLEKLKDVKIRPGSVADDIIKSFQELKDLISAVGTLLDDLAARVAQTFDNVVSSVRTKINELIRYLNQVLPKALQVPQFKTPGEEGGPPKPAEGEVQEAEPPRTGDLTEGERVKRLIRELFPQVQNQVQGLFNALDDAFKASIHNLEGEAAKRLAAPPPAPPPPPPAPVGGVAGIAGPLDPATLAPATLAVQTLATALDGVRSSVALLGPGFMQASTALASFAAMATGMLSPISFEIQNLIIQLDALIAKLAQAVQAQGQLQSPQQQQPAPGAGFSHGGRVFGAGSATSDSVPAWLSNGEFVVRAAAVRKYGATLFERLNAGRFASGGAVGYATGGFFGQKGKTYTQEDVDKIIRAIQEGIKEGVRMILSSHNTFVALFDKAMVDMVNSFNESLKAAEDSVTAFTQALQSAQQSGGTPPDPMTVVNSLMSTIKSMVGVANDVNQLWVTSFRTKTEGLNRGVKKIADTVGLGFASGGPVHGAGSSRSDSIPARLSNGEFVMNAEAVRKYGVNFLHALNFGKFANGGFVEALGFAAGGLTNLSPSLNMAPPSTPEPARVGRPLTLVLDNQRFANLSGPVDVVNNLEKYATLRQSASAGRKPSWMR